MGHTEANKRTYTHRKTGRQAQRHAYKHVSVKETDTGLTDKGRQGNNRQTVTP